LTLRENTHGWQRVRGAGTKGAFAFASYCWNDETMADFLGSPNNQIVSWEEVAADNRKLVKLTYRYRYEKLDYGGWFLFSPSNSWALLEHGREKDDYKMHLAVSYENLEEDVPRLKEVKNYLKDSSGAFEETWQILEITRGAIPKDEFTLGAYGLPDPWRPRTSPLWTVIWVTLALAAAGVAVRILMRWKARKPSLNT
jgi:hypothetical protein